MTSGPRRVLLIEDTPAMQAVTHLALERLCGFAVASCHTGEAALALAPGFSPDLLLIDLILPGMDGRATLAALRALPETATTPAIFLTARADAARLTSLADPFLLGVIIKPFDPHTLCEQLSALCQQAN